MGQVGQTACDALGNYADHQYKPNTPVSHHDDEVDDDPKTGQTRIIVACIGYDKPENDGVHPLKAREAGDQVMALCQQCGIQDVVKLYDTDANTDACVQAITDMGARCQEGDTMIFYFNGHGAQDTDQDGDEEDGQDEMFFTVQPDGSIDWEHTLTDDLFAETVCDAIGGKGVKFITFADCCHSGTICDFHKGIWGDDNAVCISACLAKEVSFGGAKGGMATNAMIAALSEMDSSTYSVGQIYDKTLEVYNRDYSPGVMSSIGYDMHMEFSNSPSGGPNSIAWPLIPTNAKDLPVRSLGEITSD